MSGECYFPGLCQTVNTCYTLEYFFVCVCVKSFIGTWYLFVFISGLVITIANLSLCCLSTLSVMVLFAIVISLQFYIFCGFPFSFGVSFIIVQYQYFSVYLLRVPFYSFYILLLITLSLSQYILYHYAYFLFFCLILVTVLWFSVSFYTKHNLHIDGLYLSNVDLLFFNHEIWKYSCKIYISWIKSH